MDWEKVVEPALEHLKQSSFSLHEISDYCYELRDELREQAVSLKAIRDGQKEIIAQNRQLTEVLQVTARALEALAFAHTDYFEPQIFDPDGDYPKHNDPDPQPESSVWDAQRPGYDAEPQVDTPDTPPVKNADDY